MPVAGVTPGPADLEEDTLAENVTDEVEATKEPREHQGPQDEPESLSIFLLIAAAAALGGLIVSGVVTAVYVVRRSGTAKAEPNYQSPTCPHCGAAYPEEGKFCIKCGRPRETTGTEK